MIVAQNRQVRIALIGFCFVLALAWFCYRPALGGAFQLDDLGNLGGLSYVEDMETALDFVLSGTAGPSGRPIALATFALQADSWDQNPAAFLRLNILIHLVNAVLLAAFLYQLALAQGAGRDKSAIVATLAAACWVLMPLLATSSMLVVQRMTTVSALFSLLGLNAYLLARTRLEEAPRTAIVWMSVSLVVATPLATLTKETGVLLPLFVLVLEATVLQLPRSVARRSWRVWQALFLALPAVIVAAYLANRIDYSAAEIARRGFTGWQRLLSEMPLLWIYLKKALVGLPATLGVYQTPPEASRGLLEPVVLLSTIGWLAMVTVAIVRRRRWPLLSLAVLWYLAGHLMESTTLPLELYFEHRNYLPIVGPVYALIAALIIGAGATRRVAFVIIPLYLVLNATLLYTFASMSGDPSTSARYWATRYPDSVRAVTTLAQYQLSEEGPLHSLSTIDRFVIRQPQHGYLRIQELNIRCLIMPDEDHSVVLQELHRELPAVDFTYTAGGMLRQLLATSAGGSCNGVSTDTVAELAGRLLQNPGYANNPAYRQFHYKLLADIARRQGDRTANIDYLRRAIAERPARDLNWLMVTSLANSGDVDAANAFIDSALQQTPRNPLHALMWRRELHKLRAYIEELERYTESPESDIPGEHGESGS